MRSYRLHLISWLIGLIGVVGVFYYFQPHDFGEMLRDIGVAGALCWLTLTLVARIILIEVVVIPIAALGFDLRRWDAFWIGWVRTFTNQILPMSGLAMYVHEVRRKIDISWSELAALTSPQFFLAATGLGLIGVSATVLNADLLGSARWPMIIAFLTIASAAFLIATGAAWFIESMPEPICSRIDKVASSFRQLAQHPHLIGALVAWHCVAILVRGGRIWILFAAAGLSLDWREALLVATVAESSMLFQVTPGGLGLREGAIVGGSALLSIPADIAAGVALIDRFFVVGLTTLFAAPAFYLLRRGRD